MVNETLVRQLFADENPIGQLIRMGGRYTEIIGVVEDEALTARAASAPTAYHFQRQWISGNERLDQMVRVDGDPLAIIPAVRAALAEIDPALVVFQPRALSDVIGAGTEQERFAALLLAVFGALAVLLAGLGLYGVLSQHVRRQQHEIGVRIALGAGKGGVLRMVVHRGVRLAVLGALAGSALAFALGSTLQSFMFEVSARDPLVLATAPLILLGIAAVASYVPALRATRIDPVEAFRED